MKLYICDICGRTVPQLRKIVQVTVVLTRDNMQETVITHYHLDCYKDNIYKHLEPIKEVK